MAALVPGDYAERVARWREAQRREGRLTLLMWPLILVLAGVLCGVGYYLWTYVWPGMPVLVAVGVGTLAVVGVGLHRLVLALE